MLMSLVQCILHRFQRRLSQWHFLRSWGIETPTPNSLEWHKSTKEGKWTISSFFCTSFYDLLLFAPNFSDIPKWNCLKLFPFFVHCCLCIWNLHRLRHRNATNCFVIQNSALSLQCIHHESFSLLPLLFVKMVGHKQNLAPVWQKLMRDVDIEEPTSFLDHFYLGCLNGIANQMTNLLDSTTRCLNLAFLLE